MAQWRHARWARMGWLALLLALFCPPAFNAPLLKLTEDFAQADLVDYADLLIDPAQQIAIGDIERSAIADRFAPASSGAFQRVDPRSAYWLRFGIDNPLPKARLLALNLRGSHEATIAAFTSSLQPLPLQRAPLLQLLIPPQSRQIYYLRIGPGTVEAAQFELLSFERYLTRYRAQSWLSGVLQSCLLLIAIAAIFTGLLRRNSTYWWLAGYSLALTVFQAFSRADFDPLTFQYLAEWSYRQPFLQACLLLSNLCGIRIAQCLPITKTRAQRAVHPLALLLLATACALPVLWVLPPMTAAILVIIISVLSQVATISISLYNFVFSYRRELLFYALLRASIFALTIGGAFAWQMNSSLRELTDNLIPIAMVTEAMGLFAILLWFSFEQQHKRARGERDIAVLEAEARSRTEIVAELGHRVRTPISGVLGMLDMLQDTALSATQLDYLNTIRRASNELLNAIDELSDVSRLQGEAAHVQQNIFDPQALITECVDGFRSASAAHQLELINDLAPELPPFVSGDVTRLRQIMLQLLHQAVSQHERGEIVLQVQQLQRNWLHFDIRTRAAIAATTPSEIDRRANQPGSANVRFAIARQLVDMLGGRIQIDDLADGNLHAWFDLELPTVERNLPTTESDTTLQNKRALLIDDNVTFCDVIERQLKHWGMTVYTAHSASEGLARLRNQITLSEPIDVLLVDTDISELYQSEWAQRLRSEIDPAPIVIFLSSQPEHRAHLLPLDSHRLLLKPINHASLKITLIEAFKQREQRLLPAPHGRNEPIRCLFAEDNIVNAKVLASMLDKLGVSYTAVSNGQEAVDACRRERFDLILMDGDMPVMDGWEASRRIREMFESRGMPSLPIIALTANTVEELGERARQSVTDAHLVKPIRLQNLRELLEQWTGKIVAPADSESI